MEGGDSNVGKGIPWLAVGVKQQSTNVSFRALDFCRNLSRSRKLTILVPSHQLGGIKCSFLISSAAAIQADSIIS